jgi:hypothetical protein
MEMMITPPGPDGSPPRIEGWPDSGGIAVITWRGPSEQVYQQELASHQDAAELLTKIAADDELDLVSAQLRRVGIGPDS